VNVSLAYGRGRLAINVPDERTTVIEPSYVEGLPDEATAIRHALRQPIGSQPLRTLVSTEHTVAISVCDITRPMPSSTLLPVLLEELSHVPTTQIKILIAAGTHRECTRDELVEMLGESIVDHCQIINHNAFDESSLVHLGEVEPDVPIWLNRHWVDADIRITTGFVEPHFFAGFSGGPKLVAPGLAGFKTTMRLHDAEMIGSTNARWGITEGNPIHDAIRRIAAHVGVHFSVDVAINRNREITSLAAGNLFDVHQIMAARVKQSAMQAFETPFDVVVTTNSGYPLDQNLYQSIKGVSAAAQVVKPGGAIICAAECSDGLPSHGEYGDILNQRDTPEDLLEMICAPGHNRHDQWEVQIQAQIQQQAQVFLKSDGLSHDDVRAAHLLPIDDVEATVLQQLDHAGNESRLCVLPEGPQTIPYLTAR
jgi:nickel-dependent lactate racemase